VRWRLLRTSHSNAAPSTSARRCCREGCAPEGSSGASSSAADQTAAGRLEGDHGAPPCDPARASAARGPREQSHYGRHRLERNLSTPAANLHGEGDGRNDRRAGGTDRVDRASVAHAGADRRDQSRSVPARPAGAGVGPERKRSATRGPPDTRRLAEQGRRTRLDRKGGFQPATSSCRQRGWGPGPQQSPSSS